MKHFLVIGLAALAIAAFAPQTRAAEPQKKAPPAIHHVVPKAGPATRGFHVTPGHAAVGAHPMHAALPNRNAHFGNPALRRNDQLHRVQAVHRDENVRNDRLRAEAVHRDQLRRDERLRAEHINARDARLAHERARAQSAGDNSSADADNSDADSSDSADDSSSDSGSSPTDAKVQALGTLLNLLQGGGKK